MAHGSENLLADLGDAIAQGKSSCAPGNDNA
jgi:hypothetical protein